MNNEDAIRIPVYLETGSKRSMACALEWPGWSRGGASEEAALLALYTYGLRYAAAVEGAQAGFIIPSGAADFIIVERLKGDSSTDYGVPVKIPDWDLQPVTTPELERLESLLISIWHSFDRTVLAAQGKELRKGPRGGGRELEQIVQHVMESEAGYLANLGVKHDLEAGKDAQEEHQRLRQASLEGVYRSRARRAAGIWPARGETLEAAAVHTPGGLARPGPRLGNRRPDLLIAGRKAVE